jgi:hypothetical protein
MSRLNIRCCCQPEKVLGSMLWPEPAPGVWPARYDGTPMPFWTLTYKESIFAPISHVTLQVREFQDLDGRREWAVYGEDRPIEFWKHMRGYLPPERPGLRG